jgi:hypothetical protein
MKWKMHRKNETKNETVARSEWNRINFILTGGNEEKIEMKRNETNTISFSLAMNEKKMKQLPGLNETVFCFIVAGGNEIAGEWNKKLFHSFVVADQDVLWQLP